jgi:hypothetical protein
VQGASQGDKRERAGEMSRGLSAPPTPLGPQGLLTDKPQNPERIEAIRRNTCVHRLPHECQIP